MIILLQKGADADWVREQLHARGQWPRPELDAQGHTVAFNIGRHSPPVAAADLCSIDGVAQVLEAPSGHPLLDARAGQPVMAGGHCIGDGTPLLFAGPCAVESEAQIHEAAAMVAAAGGRFLRGGAFKPRTSPYAFAGHGEVALGWLRDAADRHGLAVVTEPLSETHVDAVAEHADLLQIGTRNMQNFALLRAAGATGRPVLLKRGFAATIDEWLLAGEYLLQAGAAGVVFCERGIRAVTEQTRNVLDLAAAALLTHSYGLPVLVDPSHALGRRDLVIPMVRAALAVGAAGVLVEAHPDPATARSDAAQALRPAELARVGAAFRNACDDGTRAGSVYSLRAVGSAS